MSKKNITHEKRFVFVPFDRFYLNMYTFFMRALIIRHQKMGPQISQHIFELFLELNIPVHNLLFEFCNGIF